MRNLSKIVWGLGWLILAIVLGCGIGLLVSKNGSRKVDEPPATPVMEASPATNAEPVVSNPITNAPKTVATESVPKPLAWNDKLNDVLVSEASEDAKANQILAMMATAPDEGKVELAQHLANLTSDENYSGAADLLTNATTLPGVQTVLMNDLLNRNNNLKLPTLLAVARNDAHPLHSEAKDVLELVLQTDKGTNWDEWQTTVDLWLKDNQDQ